ncbi:neuronal acetylcholine receptor subunit alpha-9-like [Oculina patagonica]
MLTRRLNARWCYLSGLLLALTLAAMDFQCCYAQLNRTKIEQSLIKALFKDYDSEGRPVLNLSKPVLVKFGIAYSNLHSLDEKNQVLTSNVWIRQQWHDPWLIWEPSKYSGLSSINISPNLVWKPDIVLHNNVNEEGDHGEQYLFDTKVIISSDGTVTWLSPNLIKSSCKINVKYFPWDMQTCYLKFGSWTFHGLKLDLAFYGDQAGADLSAFTHNGEWDLLSADAKKNVVHYGCCPEPYPDLTFEIKIKRRTLFYINNLIVPCVVLALLTATAFLFPPETGERISLMITILLGMTVFMIVVIEAIPSTSEVTPLISTYFSVVMIEISLGLLCTCISLNIEHHHPKIELTGWFRYVLFEVLGPILSSGSVKRLKKKQLKNKEIKPSDCYVKENQVMPEEDKITVTDITSREDVNKNTANVGEKELKVAGMDKVSMFIDRALAEDKRKLEWHVAVNVIDNFFFVLFIITIIISSLVVLIQPKAEAES